MHDFGHQKPLSFNTSANNKIEYPGAQDIPGIPKSDPFDGKAYVALLQNLRFRLGTSRTISIAAPGMLPTITLPAVT